MDNTYKMHAKKKVLHKTIKRTSGDLVSMATGWGSSFWRGDCCPSSWSWTNDPATLLSLLQEETPAAPAAATGRVSKVALAPATASTVKG